MKKLLILLFLFVFAGSQAQQTIKHRQAILDSLRLKDLSQIPTSMALYGTTYSFNDSLWYLNRHDSTPQNLMAFVDRWLLNGTFKETFNSLVSTTGGTHIIVTTEQAGGGDLLMHFTTGDFVLDCTPPQVDTLTAGTATNPQENFTYVPLSTKVITVSTTEWPSEEHIKITYSYVQTVALVASDGALINQNWNDHEAEVNGEGHLTSIAERLRRIGAAYFSGVNPSGATDSYFTTSAGSVTYQATVGQIYQMHLHNYAAKNTLTGDDIHIRNASGNAFQAVTNLYDITVDASGGTLNNKYFNIVIFGVANKDGEYSPVMINMPTGTYNTQSAAEEDISGHDVYSIPREFNIESSTAFLICRATFRKTGGSWAWQSTVDLRGTTPSQVTGAGGGSAALVEFPDNLFKIYNSTDITQALQFVLDNVTAGNTRLITMADRDIDLQFVLESADYDALTDANAQLPDLHTDGSPTFNALTITSITDGTASWTGNDLTGFVDITATDTITGGWMRASNNGTPSIPAFGWASNGMYKVGTNSIGFATDNILSATIENDQDWLFAQNITANDDIITTSGSPAFIMIDTDGGDDHRIEGNSGDLFLYADFNDEIAGSDISFRIDNVEVSFLNEDGKQQWDGEINVDGTGDSYVAGSFGVGVSVPGTKFVVNKGGNIPALGGFAAQSSAVFSNTSAIDALNRLFIIAGSTGSTGASIVNFGDADDLDIGGISYMHSDNSFIFRANNTSVTTLDGSGNLNTIGSFTASISNGTGNFVTESSGLLKYRTAAEVLSDIGAEPTLTPAALTRTNDENITVTLGGTPSTSLLQATSLTMGWAGFLKHERGGLEADVSAYSGLLSITSGVTSPINTSAGVAGLLSDETGFNTTGLMVFNNAPVIITPTIASFTNANHDHADAAGGGTLLASDIPIADVGVIITATEVEGALQENRTAINLNTDDSHVAVTLAGTPDYITIDGSQVITRNKIDLTAAADVTGLLPDGNLAQNYLEDADLSLLRDSVGQNKSDIATNVTAIDLNTTHRSSDGSDHSFLDQAVTITANVIHATLLANGDITTTSGSPAFIMTDTDGGDDHRIEGNGGDLFLYADYNNEVPGSDISFRIDNVEKAFLSSVGDWQLDGRLKADGTTTSYVMGAFGAGTSSPSRRFTVEFSGLNDGAAIKSLTADALLEISSDVNGVDANADAYILLKNNNLGKWLIGNNEDGPGGNTFTIAQTSFASPALYITSGNDTFIADDLTVAGNNFSINGVNYQWPGADGNAGDRLQTDGGLVLTWVTPTASLIFKGTINGTNGVPTAGGSALIDGTGTTGWFYRTAVAGTYDYGNPSGNNITLAVGQDILYNGVTWESTPVSGGTVESVAVATANGFAGTVATPTTTPVITLTTTITGLLKGNGTAISAAIANTDYLPVNNPVMTGFATFPTPFTLGAVSVTATGAELNHVVGVTSAIQTQLDARLKLNTANDPVTGALELSNTLELSKGSQDFLFTDNSTNLAIQGQTAGVQSSLELFTKDGDGTDIIGLHLYSKGTPGSVGNSETLEIEFMAVANEARISTQANGTGTLRPLVIFTEGNTDQIKLNTDGSVSIADSILVPLRAYNATTWQNSKRGVSEDSFRDKIETLQPSGDYLTDGDFSSNGIMLRIGAGSYSILTDNSSNWNTAYTNRITSLTTTGSSGASTLISNTLNVPTYTLAGLGGEPSFSKNTAFNKNFGTSAGTVAEGDDSRINNGQTAFGWGNHASEGYAKLGTSGNWSANQIFNDNVKLGFGSGGVGTDAFIQWSTALSPDGLQIASDGHHYFTNIAGAVEFNTNDDGVNIPSGNTYQVAGADVAPTFSVIVTLTGGDLTSSVVPLKIIDAAGPGKAIAIDIGSSYWYYDFSAPGFSNTPILFIYPDGETYNTGYITRVLTFPGNTGVDVSTRFDTGFGADALILKPNSDIYIRSDINYNNGVSELKLFLFYKIITL